MVEGVERIKRVLLRLTRGVAVGVLIGDRNRFYRCIFDDLFLRIVEQRQQVFLIGYFGILQGLFCSIKR